MYPFLYWAEFWDEVDNCVYQISGCTFGKNFAEATVNIDSYYGENLYNLRIERLEEDSILEFATYEEARKIADN